MRKTILKLKIASLSLAILGGFILPTSGASAATATNQGVVFSWPDLVFAPQSTSEQSTYAFDISYSNNSGKDYYYAGYSLSSPEDKLITGDLAIGVKNGSSGKLRVTLSYLNFLNFTGPANYLLNLCTRVALGEKETCTKGTVAIKKKESTDVTTPNPSSAPVVATGSSVTVQGVTVTWPEKIYVPSNTNFPVQVSFSNNSGKDILKAEWLLKDSSGNTISSRSIIGLKNGSTGYETDNVINSSFKSGPGTYRVIVRVEGYDGTGTFQEEKSIQVLPWSQNQQQPFSASLMSGSNSLTLNGFTFSWPSNLTVPTEGNNVGIEIQFSNKTGVDILSAELMLVDYKGSRIFQRSVIGLKSGATSIQEDNTISSSYPLGAGVYKIVATIKDYSGEKGAMGTAYVEVKTAPGPPQTVSDLSATRSSSSIDYTFTKPSSFGAIDYYTVFGQVLLAPGLEPNQYISYKSPVAMKNFNSESFSLTKEEIAKFLTGKVPDISNTSIMIKIAAHSSYGYSYYSNGIYTLTSGFISSSTKTSSNTGPKTILCTKGQMSKFVTGASPKCPKGFKKK
jgi:hypothetical protein